MTVNCSVWNSCFRHISIDDRRKARRLAMERVFDSTPGVSSDQLTSPEIRYPRPASAIPSPVNSGNNSPIREEDEEEDQGIEDVDLGIEA